MPQPFLDACALAALVRDGTASPAELVDDAIDRIEKLNPELNAVIRTRFDEARLEAAAELPDGPFRGVPIVLKDLLCYVAGEEIHEGMQVLKKARYVAPRHQELARRLRAAGFIVVGRTNTPELGILPTTEPVAYGPTRNPWDTARSTGGSSGGSAAAVASGMVPVGHANDGGGSIRIPASECGLVGLKPSRGRVPLGPEWGDVMGGLVCELAVTRTVRDTAAVLDAVAGPAPGTPTRRRRRPVPTPRRSAPPGSPPHRDAERRLRRGRGDAPRLRGRRRGRGSGPGVARPCRRADARGGARRPRVRRDLPCRVVGRHRLRRRPLLVRQAGPVRSPRTTSSPSRGRSPTRDARRARRTS